MATPRLLMDNDALLKAAHWGLLDIVPSLVVSTWGETACLPTFPPRVRRAEPKLFSDASVAKALEMRLAMTAPLPEPDVSVLSVLQSEPGIDAGELLLFGALAATPAALLLTGDKRALRAVALTDVQARFQNRVVCVEQLMSHALDKLGVVAIVEQVRRWTPRDQTALAIFGRQGGKSEADLREGLASYLRSIDKETNGLLVRNFGL
jgi:hypothetical protein